MSAVFIAISQVGELSSFQCTPGNTLGTSFIPGGLAPTVCVKRGEKALDFRIGGNPFFIGKLQSHLIAQAMQIEHPAAHRKRELLGWM